jgi:hypothetical protein
MTPSHTRPRRATALAVVLLLGVGLGAAPAPTQAAGARSRPGLGFRIERTPHADGTWVGRYRVGRQLAYRTQPRKSSAQSAYRLALPVGHVPGSSPAGTRRSAWVLSTYGGTRDRTTAAAVDVAVNALLNRGKWRVGAPYTVRRTNRTGDGRLIRTFAKIMLRQSKQRQGPYRTTLKARRVPVGDQTTVTVRLQNKRGLGPVITGQQRGLALAVRYGEARTRTVFLNNHGVGRVFFRAAPGKTRITAAVHLVPDVALFVRRPTNGAASRLAVAGHHRKVKRRVSGLAISTQTVRITNRSTSVLVGRPLLSTYSVAGLTGRENVDYAVYGPFPVAATRCSGTPAITAKATIKSNGTRSLPRWRPGRTGFYAWRVAARGNSTTRPASACGSAYRTERNTTTAQSRAGAGRTVTLGHAFGTHIKVSGFDRVEVHTVRTRVYGPFVHKAKTHCARGRLFRTLLTTVDNNDEWNKTIVVNRSHNTGYYVFQTTLDAGTFMRGSRSRCGSTIRVTR